MILPSRYLLWCVLALAGCSPTATVRQRTPVAPTGVSENVSQDYRESVRLAKHQPLVSLGYALDAVRLLEARLAEDDRSAATVSAYNHAVARVVDAIDRAEIDPWSTAVQVPSGNYSLRAKLAHAEPSIHPSNYRMIPTDTLEIGGKYFKHQVRQDGLGAPIAMVSKHQGLGIKHDLSESIVYGTATAVVSFQGREAELRVIESLRTDIVSLDGKTYPLAADFSTPLALLLSHQHVEKLGLVRLLVPDRYADTARLTRLQLYDPERIPVLMVHGLDSTPATWTPMVNALRADPDLRKRYQYWVFSYPSGYPYPYSASLLRKQLDSINTRFPRHKPIVLLGHSMGGMIDRLMLTDSGDSIWKDYFGKSPAETRIPGMYRKGLEESLIFDHRKEIGRTIFISTPHRGSDIAISSFGRMFSRLVRAPTFLANTRDAVISLVTLDATALNLQRAPSSIDTLAPNNRFVLAVNKLPITRSIPYHSIIGDRGRGDTPNSSDGVVPYWSSHLDGAVSEKIVPSNHSAHQNPEAIAEVRRILRLHAGLGAGSSSSDAHTKRIARESNGEGP
ncbi:MAG: alpha/beta fold hydrolase [Verrucomicrobiota bacterium]